MPITRRGFLQGVGGAIAAAIIPGASIVADRCAYCGSAYEGSARCRSCGSALQEVGVAEIVPSSSVTVQGSDQIKLHIGNVTYYVLHRQPLTEPTPVELEVSSVLPGVRWV